MRAGCSKEIITPTKPTKLACCDPFDRNFKYIHDDVYIRCLVINDNSKTVVFMSMDLLFHDAILNDEIANYANEKYGIGKSSVVVGYTHSHNAPAARGYNLNHHDDEYEEFIVSRAKSCLDRAMCSMFEASLEYGAFDADFNISRRGKFNGEFNNVPDFYYPRDREFAVICVRDGCGDIRSTITNYACHPVFHPSNDSVSAEFPGRLCQLLDTRYYGCVSMFFQSSGADVRPRPSVDYKKLGNQECDWQWRTDLTYRDVSDFAEDMCRAVSNCIETRMCKKEILLDSESFEIELPMEGKPIEYFKEMEQMLKNKADNPMREHALYIANGGYAKLSDSLLLRGAVIKLSDDLYVATLGGEPCFGVKNAVKKAFGEKNVFFIGYTDACAYIVDDRVLAEGGYEPTCHLEYCLKGPFKPFLDEKYTSAFETALHSLAQKNS